MKNRETLTKAGRSYISPDSVLLDFEPESMLAYSNTERIGEDNNEYPWDN